METSYLLWKMLHIFGVMLFVGNIIVTAFWKLMADRSRDPHIVAFGQRLVNWTDLAFTCVGAAIILVSGLMMSGPYSNDFWAIPWLVWGVGMFLASGLVWVVALFPLQIKQGWLVEEFAQNGEIPDRYWRLGRLWIRFAFVAVALALGNLYFMVVKPL